MAAAANATMMLMTRPIKTRRRPIKRTTKTKTPPPKTLQIVVGVSEAAVEVAVVTALTVVTMVPREVTVEAVVAVAETVAAEVVEIVEIVASEVVEAEEGDTTMTLMCIAASAPENS